MNRQDAKQISDVVWEIPPRGAMRVPARIYASERMLESIFSDNAPEQAMNVACLPGIVSASMAMPDIHWGYGFPIGGVAAFDVDDGVISPGGVGYDINCGVRLMSSGLSRGDVEPKLKRLMEDLYRAIPTGVGASGAMRVSRKELETIACRGAQWAMEKGYATEADIACIEENGCLQGADPGEVSQRAWKRAAGQVGTLGSGNHFLEVGYVAEVYDEPAARKMGLELDSITTIIHCGSRGFGHQICGDYLSVMDRAVQSHRIHLPDRQLACAPVQSREGERYLKAMRCAVNYAFANRQVIAHGVRRAFERALGMDAGGVRLRTVYEVAHNIAKLETHRVEGVERELCVHRKGATRAFAPGCRETPEIYRDLGQPVLIPGDMGRYSYVLTGTGCAMEETFGSTCHGAGRTMSRKRAVKVSQGRDIVAELKKKGIMVLAQNRRTVAEEMSEAYKDVAEVVDTCVRAGISRKVAKLCPLGCIKG